MAHPASPDGIKEVHVIRKFVLAAAFCALAAPAMADADLKLGTLTCKLTDIDNEIVYTDETFACTFAPSSGKSENYSGVIKEIGVNLSVTKGYTLTWYVVAGSLYTYKPGDMAGTYGGASADASAGSGGGAQYLVGGFNNEINLQPWAAGEVEGTGVSIGIESFELKVAN